jgi:hypothetical protein
MDERGEMPRKRDEVTSNMMGDEWRKLEDRGSMKTAAWRRRMAWSRDVKVPPVRLTHDDHHRFIII